MNRLLSSFLAASLCAEIFLLPTPTQAQAPGPIEPLGQSSRRTSLVISEIMYHPADRADGKNLEFVEIFNALSTPEDISGYRLDGDADYVFPTNTIIPGRSFLVVAQAPADVASVYGIANVLGPFSNTNSLPNDRGSVQLRNRIGALFLEAQYDTDPPWPAAADGSGHSLVLARPSYGEGNVAAWAASDSVNGSPGQLDSVTVDPIRNVMINEFLAHTDDPEVDFIELYNHSNVQVDISGCFLSDSADTNKFVIPPNTLLPPRGFALFYQTNLGFSLSSGGETIYFRNPLNTRVLDAVRFGPQANGVSSGRYPNGSPTFSELMSRTPGTNNTPLLIRDMVINEILYNPISLESDDEFIELYNKGSNSVNLSGWRLSGGISYTFPTNTIISSNGYLVVARNVPRFLLRNPGLTTNNTLGNFNGNLANGGERIALTIPDAAITTNNNVVTTNFNDIVVDEVTYGDGGRWGQWSDGGGSSLELMDPRSDNRLAANWADSDESAKGPWTIISVPGVLDTGTTAADQLQVLLFGAGECLIDDVEVLNQAGVNLIANSTFEGGIAGWTAEGTEEQSGLETTGGYNSTRSYHVRASGRSDNQVNRIRTPLTAAQPAGTTNTIRAKARWLRGQPDILFRLRGNWLEAAATMTLPTHLGTPGARNSRATNNAGPAIYDVVHNPPVPAANQAVLVTARVHDPDLVSVVQLRYRVDPNATLNTLTMVDNGTAGDAVAGDGLYSATIPGQAANVLVAFRIQSTDGSGATSAFPNNAPARECLVRFGETVPTGTFPSYRFWMTQASFNAWDARNNLNNTLNDITFVLGNHRVIYNGGAVYAGSPYIAPGFNTPTGNRCGYSMEFPSDDPFLGDNALNLDWPGGHGNENTAIQEQMAYWITDQMNLPYSHRYFIRLTVNGVTDMQRGGVYEAAMQPAGEFLRQWSPGDSDGDFFKIDRAFEFTDGGGLITAPEPQLRVFTTPDLVNGGTKKKTESYRWTWLKRSFDSAHDYTNLFVLADVLNSQSPEPYTSQTESLVDLDEWMGIFAVEHIINNFDSWGHTIGKNMYMFKPEAGPWQIYMFDLDWLMLVSVNGPGNYTASSDNLFDCDDPTVTRMYNHPPFRRAYFRAVQAAVNNAFIQSKYEAVMDAKYNSLVANGITLCDGQALANPAAVKTWFSQRRTFLVSKLNSIAANFAITSNNGNDYTVNTNLITLSGTAPVDLKGIRVNGAEYAVTWTSVTNWILRLVLSGGQNSIVLEGYDRYENPLTNFTDSINITSTVTNESAIGRVIINEIIYNPLVPDAGFVEIHNNSGTTAFDLSGWRLNGVDFTFPDGTIIDPGAYLVVAENVASFAAAYGATIRVVGAFAGQLDNRGETLSLIKPGATLAQDLIIDVVSYDDDLPWPLEADGTGSSLQLIDPLQENFRVANWGVMTVNTNANPSPVWQYVTATGSASTSRLYMYMTGPGDVYVDDLKLVAGSTPESGANMIFNGDFESSFPGPWTVGTIFAGSATDSAAKHSGNNSLHIVSTGVGSTRDTSIWQDTSPLTTNSTYTLSYWYLPNTNGGGLTLRLSGNGINSSHSIAPSQTPSSLATPGSPNSVRAVLPPLPQIWINEIQPQNITGITDNAGDREPWVELYNPGPTTVSLNGWYLANNYTNLAGWAFPADASIAPGQFKLIWLDGEPAETTANALHTSFRISPASGSLALVFPFNSQPSVLDYVNYNLSADRSLGFYPDGQPGARQNFFYTTPGESNNNAVSPLPLYINEWTAQNTGPFADPVDGDFDDWFEIFNPNNVAVDLGGYLLSDSLTNLAARWTVPNGFIVPPNGFLLVWADDEVTQNTNGVQLHAGFRLSQGGESIALFAPNGSLVDSIAFGLQTNNVSEGRWPDGSTNIYTMPPPTPTPGTANTIPGLPGALIQILGTSVEPNGDIVIRWSAEAGKTYRVQSKNDLFAPAWSDLEDVIANSSVASSTNAMGGSSRRFYRIQFVP